MNIKEENQKKVRRQKRARAKIFGTASRPRLAVSRSNRYILAQLIDDTKGKTLASASDKDLKGQKTESALAVGRLIAQKAQQLGVTTVVFDRRGFQYHGRVKAVADGAREGGLKF